MATEKSPSFKTIPAGTAVHKIRTTADDTMYSVTQHDHHPGEPAVVFHSGKAPTRTGK